MYVICAGMYRSCSTWQYQIASHLIEQRLGGQRLGFVKGTEFAERCPRPSEPAVWHTLKSHDNHPDFVAALSGGYACALYSFRDLRDVTYSLMHKHAASFEDIVEKHQMVHLSLDNDRFWRSQPAVLCQRYESLMADPATGIEEIATHLGIALPAGEGSALAREYSLAANRDRTSQLADQLSTQGVDLTDPRNALLFDQHTQLHWNHIRHGQNGAWRELATPAQLARLNELLGAWLIEWGYERSDAWAAPAVTHLYREMTASRQILEEFRQRFHDALATAHISYTEQLEASRQTIEELRARLDASTVHAQELETRLAALEALTQELGVARRLHRLATSHPRITKTVKSILRMSA